ncbi:hypothetical protein G6M50_06330 [Agrobacterium rhizogenes]|nr:hypothetical protein [Rhizobium rhizogenes]NTJ77420.1 hypothetical protein [Rhizobium rhizogenes]
MTPRENDIYSWAWKDGKAPIVGCYAHLAVFAAGALRDTYWHDWRTQSCLDLERVELTLLGNIDDYREIYRWEAVYYDPADIIDMRHANNSNAVMYLRKTATKSQKWMLARAEEAFAEAHRAKSKAERDIAELQDKLKKIRAGDLEVYL